MADERREKNADGLRPTAYRENRVGCARCTGTYKCRRRQESRGDLRTGPSRLMKRIGAQCAPYITAAVFLFVSSTLNANTILVVGDSLSAGYGIDVKRGWVNLLQKKLDTLSEFSSGDFNVVNASISGDTTGAGLARLPKLLQQHTPDIVVIELGGNDGLRGFPLKIMRSNLEQMVDLSLRAKAKVLILGIQIPPNYGQRYTDSFAKVFSAIADKKQVAFMPFFIESAFDTNLMQEDGIHPRAEAQPQILEDVWPHIESLVSSLQSPVSSLQSPVSSLQSPVSSLQSPKL